MSRPFYKDHCAFGRRFVVLRDLESDTCTFFYQFSFALRRFVPACRAASIVVKVLPVPGGEFAAHPWLDIMDPAPGSPIVRSPEKGASPQFRPIRVLPVADPGDPGQVIDREGRPTDLPPIAEPDGDVLQDIQAPGFKPWYEVLIDPFLAPSPPFAATSALEAVLIRSHGHRSMVIFEQ